MTGSVDVMTGTYPLQRAGEGSTAGTALHQLQVIPIPFVAAKRLLERHHYLHSLPGGTHLTLGVMMGNRLMGAIALGAGPQRAFSLVEGASPDDCLTLNRLWLSDDLPHNSESRVLGIVIRSLRKHTSLKFLITYADPCRGHAGTIYMATNWLYTGLSAAMPLCDLGDGKPHHSRSLGHCFGTHSLAYLNTHGIPARAIPQSGKHRYVYFLEPSWRERLRVPVLPYPKKEVTDGGRSSALVPDQTRFVECQRHG